MNVESWPWALLIAVYVCAAIIVWLAGTRLARFAGAISDKTRLGEATVGVVLLAASTSLPEFAVSTVATFDGVPMLPVNDVLGSAALNVVILAIADAASRREALTSQVPDITVVMQGVLCIIMMVLVAIASSLGDGQFLGIGWGSWLLVIAYAICVRVMTQSRSGQQWRPRSSRGREESGEEDSKDDRSLKRLLAYTALCALAILVGGFFLARTGETLAERTGLGASFFGAVVLAIATSLPELSSVLEGVRLRRYTMAISEVFGTNLFNVTIIVYVDALHRGKPVLAEAGAFSVTAALLGLVLTSIFLVGMLERRDRTVLRMGYDSFAVVLVYLAGLALLYAQR